MILQIDQGCPYNRCTFCGMYRQVRFHRRSMPEIQRLLDAETRQSRGVRRVFLADGDVMRRPFAELQTILQALAQRLPELARVNVYATGRAIADKTDPELRALRAGKLQTLYLGLESGDEETLRRVCKGEDAATMVEAARRAQACGLKISAMVLLGLGGQARSGAHADATADALNRMQPRLLAALRVVPVPGTELHAAVRAGHFRQVTERGVIEEMRRLVARLELTNTVFRANHSSNIVPLEARLPRDKQALLAQLDALLASGVLNAEAPGPQPLWL
ncbi:MAG: radical SAM protein [Kiritimatiellia bacterium]